jgi:arylsulfatase A
VIGRIRAEDQVPLIQRYTEKTISFIRDAHAKDRPFFVYLAHNAVHFPRYPAEKFRGSSPNGLLGDWVQEVDWSVGQVLAALRELRLDRHTLVLFVSDNGGPTQQGATNTPLRGSKGSTLEGGIRVPGLAWWPGHIPAGTSTDAITAMIDVLPTFAKLARAPLAADRKIDGVDISSVLLGSPATPPRDSFLYHRGFLLEAVRSGPWKLHLAKKELYNLATDIGEATDVAAQNPEVVRRLVALAEASKDDLGLDGIGPGCRPHIRQAVVAAAVAEGEAFVVHAEEVQDGGVESRARGRGSRDGGADVIRRCRRRCRLSRRRPRATTRSTRCDGRGLCRHRRRVCGRTRWSRRRACRRACRVA